MNIKRFVARTSREALAMVRAELGEDAIVLKNRALADGVEILAMAEEALPGVEQVRDERAEDSNGWAQAGAARQAAFSTATQAGPAGSRSAASSVAASGRELHATRAEADEAMSTVNFEAYVRERQARRHRELHEGRSPEPEVRAQGGRDMAHRDIVRREFVQDDIPSREIADRRGADPRFDNAGVANRRAASVEGSQRGSSRARLERENFEGQSFERQERESVDTAALMSELRALRGFLSGKIESVSWFEGVRRRPAQADMLRRLIDAGFSAALSRKLADHLPADFNEAQAEQWLHAALRRNIKVEAPGESIFDAGGTFALLGPTGVGKTTTAAKIAAQFALRHGAQSVGLITADVYRIGAQDQLRTFGRLLGVPVHVAHDVATLADFLQMSMNRKLVLIDTAGMGQRDERVSELLAGFNTEQVRRIVVLNAAMQASALDEVVDAYQATSAAGVVLSKIDETVQLGGALDCLIRHRLPLQGVANGQRVPEDWHRPDAGVLVDLALAARSARPTAFSFDDAELAMLLSAGAGRGEAPLGGLRVRNV